MAKFDWKSTIKINIWKLKAVGLWPRGNGIYELNLYTLWTAISFCCIISAHNIFQTINIFLLNDLKAVTSIIFLNLSELLGMVKAYYLFKNMPILKQLLVVLKSGIFQPKDERQQELIKPNLKQWSLNYIVFWTMSIGAIFFWVSIPILNQSYKNYELPFSAWYPFETNVSPNYEITYMYQVVGVLFVATSTLGVDTLIAALTMYTGAQIDLLCDNLRHLCAKNFRYEFSKCIKHHKKILSFADRSNKFFNWIVFYQFFISATSIGITMFQMTVVDSMSGDFLSLVSFEIAIIVEIFIFCWFANEVIEKSNKIPYALFESDWADAPLEEKKSMIIFILKCQRPLKISPFNLFDLSLDVFMKILRTSWSYFTLLQQMSPKK